MRKTTKILAAAVLGLSLAPISARGALVITEVMSSSAHTAGTNNADWFELTNNGIAAFDLTGFTWDDNDNVAGTATFGGITSIPAGSSIVFTGETLGAEASFKSNWNIPGSVTVVHLGSAVFQSFSSGGDQIHIYNASNLSVLDLTFGAATNGLTFEWDRDGNSLGLSVIGQNSAYQASSNGQDSGNGPGVDVGSPGISVVPEPASLALLSIGGLALLARRRTVI